MNNKIFAKKMKKAASYGWKFLSAADKQYFRRRNITKEMIDEMEAKHTSRMAFRFFSKKLSRVQKVISDLKFFKEVPYSYSGDGLDDFNRFQRPASNGVGWVAICPGERGNNYYIDDPVTVAILRRKYNEWKSKKVA